MQKENDTAWINAFENRMLLLNVLTVNSALVILMVFAVILNGAQTNQRFQTKLSDFF